MPRYKSSQGSLRFSTTYPEEFQRWLCYELANSASWNQKTMKLEITGYRNWVFTSPIGIIKWNGTLITVESKESRWTIRSGLVIDMGNGKIIIDSTIK